MDMCLLELLVVEEEEGRELVSEDLGVLATMTVE
jgi:hypothetical protein